ncbi:hypothetical protein [Chitinophaga defluvii]|uniref:HEAT repeat protein n=1 Tax=Chitinophaga defluvii TaxID=3163343 RepID=A0ABV2T2W9_9BACT
MELLDEILWEHSREQAVKITVWIGNNPRRFKQLLSLFLEGEYRVVQRSAWIISMVAQKHPGLIAPHLHLMVKRLKDEGIPVAVKRNVIRILQFIPIPEDLHGEVMNICFEFLSDPQETIAVRCFSMTVLDNLAKAYPEIKQEIMLIVSDQLQHAPSAGFRSRARRVLGLGK